MIVLMVELVMPGSATHGESSARSAATLRDELRACGAPARVAVVLINMAQAPSRRHLI